MAPPGRKHPAVFTLNFYAAFPPDAFLEGRHRHAHHVGLQTDLFHTYFK
jgi:hypothetical protein